MSKKEIAEHYGVEENQVKEIGEDNLEKLDEEKESVLVVDIELAVNYIRNNGGDDACDDE